ncbi:MAG: hypothetical protein JOY96_08465 [Verrucomicrobia bacterium]|nr:hypothetical protein [Verrucomicrobiota bacterium]
MLRLAQLSQEPGGIVSFVVILEQSIRPYLAAKGHIEQQVEAMHRPWQKYASANGAVGEAVHGGVTNGF